MTDAFTYQGLPTRVVFGHGTLSGVAAEVERLGIRRALLLSTVEPAGRRRACS